MGKEVMLCNNCSLKRGIMDKMMKSMTLKGKNCLKNVIIFYYINLKIKK